MELKKIGYGSARSMARRNESPEMHEIAEIGYVKKPLAQRTFLGLEAAHGRLSRNPIAARAWRNFSVNIRRRK